MSYQCPRCQKKAIWGCSVRCNLCEHITDRTDTTPAPAPLTEFQRRRIKETFRRAARK